MAMTFVSYMSLGIILFCVFAIVTLKLRVKREGRALAQVPPTDEVLIGTERDLRDAEESMRKSETDLRHVITQTHVLIDRLSTMRGFNKTYMETLVEDLARKGVQAELVFQESLPLGYANLVEQTGVWELYVPRDQAELAVAELEQRFNATS